MADGDIATAGEAASLAGVKLPPVTDNYPTDEQPLAMILHCPNCGLQHIDKPDPWPPDPDALAECLQYGHCCCEAERCCDCGVYAPRKVVA